MDLRSLAASSLCWLTLPNILRTLQSSSFRMIMKFKYSSRSCTINLAKLYLSFMAPKERNNINDRKSLGSITVRSTRIGTKFATMLMGRHETVSAQTGRLDNNVLTYFAFEEVITSQMHIFRLAPSFKMNYFDQLLSKRFIGMISQLCFL